MLHSLILAASEVAKEESSKTLFYVFGGLLAVWAVVVSTIGIRSHETFPPSRSAARGVIAISVVLILCAMASAALTG